MQPMEQQKPPTIDQHSMALIREIYQLTHDVAIKNDPALRLRLAELTLEAEKRRLL